MKIWVVDAFSKEPYGGNPAAVMIVDEFLSDSQKIATEMNLSETAFVKPLGGNRYHIRWFTPEVEVELCGHATLAAAHILKRENLASEKVQFESLSGPLHVSYNADQITLDFPLQKTGEPFDLHTVQQDFGNVIQAVHAYDDVIVEIDSDVRDCIPDFDELRKIPCRGIILTSRGRGRFDFESRFFAPRVGVNEDPVTGSAHCKLAHYWQNKLGKSEFLAYQASSRGGEIALKIEGERVFLTGHCVTVLDGEWLF